MMTTGFLQGSGGNLVLNMTWRFIMQGFEGWQEYFEFNALSNGQPVELNEDQHYMYVVIFLRVRYYMYVIIFSRVRYYMSSNILNILEHLKNILWNTKQKSVTVVKFNLKKRALQNTNFQFMSQGTFLDQLQWQTSSSIFLAKYYSYNEALRWHF